MRDINILIGDIDQEMYEAFFGDEHDPTILEQD